VVARCGHSELRGRLPISCYCRENRSFLINCVRRQSHGFIDQTADRRSRDVIFFRNFR
jgi:hypothetical protein